LGDFSPLGWLFILGSFLKIIEEAQIIGLLFFSTRYVLILTKHGLGYILGGFLLTHLVTLELFRMTPFFTR
jgi:hypothetical protein